MPLDIRSAVPTVPGVPWWGALAMAAGTTLVGVLIDATRGDVLTSAFTVFYVLGCIAAVVAVRYRGLFTAMAQPPLLLLAAVPLGQEIVASGSTSGLKDLALNVAYPVVNRFPAMLLATVVCLVIGGIRIFLMRQEPGVRARVPRDRSGPKARPASGRTARTRQPAARRRSRPSGDAAAASAEARSGAQPRVSRGRASVRDVTETRANPQARRRAAPGAPAPEGAPPRRARDPRVADPAPIADERVQRRSPGGPQARAARTSATAPPRPAATTAVPTQPGAPTPSATRTEAYMPPVRYRERYDD